VAPAGVEPAARGLGTAAKKLAVWARGIQPWHAVPETTALENAGAHSVNGLSQLRGPHIGGH
jgi:hypothetical protein